MTEIPQSVLLARQMYDAHESVRAILAATGVTRAELYRALDGLPQADGSSLLPPMPRRRIRKAGPDAARLALVTRIMRAAETQLHQVEQRLANAGYQAGESERDAHALALLARTVRELAALDERNGSRSGTNKSARHDEPVPLDIDELRRSLTRKLDDLVAEQQGALTRGGDG